MWVGRVTTFCVGLAVVLALPVGAAMTALVAASGDLFKLGDINYAYRHAGRRGGRRYPEGGQRRGRPSI
ncbi:MAG TPA: hypothetical protein VJ827_11645 [Rubrobacter sp.]|nr:hypothetical protein [Rubrobacter sp.]